LNDYKSSINIYEEVIKKADKDEVSDIITNLLACSSNYPEYSEAIQKLINGLAFEKTYEFYFNLS
jgi:hypothetical protein